MMFLLKSRRERESTIVKEMISMFCQSNHKTNGKLCDDCQALTSYSEKRLQTCTFGEWKPVCKECPIHCYSTIRREQMRKVMQWTGPRMIYRKPLFAIVHIIDNLTAPKSPIRSK